ncbi:zinc finger protein VAR3, chloroplastic isoform X1 [Ricinus communis]|uniref:zinc finger protein VAR3, chloroplastic isoform X1 n=1 Tax=Ricinus communis TaxID=3988 RepID=UPI00201ACA45|nr:zinc finger protein VAR3, chloroplastic isoform X1 [Ricinus communis]
MHKIFITHYKFLHYTLRTYSKIPNFLLPISQQLHSISKTLNPSSNLDFVFNEVKALNSSKPTSQLAHPSSKANEISGYSNHTKRNDSVVQISHPWPEWVDLMEFLLKRGYFEANENPFLNGELGTKETNWIRTACLNFARDQYELIRVFSRRDIHIIAGCGCPSIDRKVVNSGKRLRAHVGIDEGNVCSSCKLRGDCERAYVKARENEGGRTVDVMRILLTYGLDSISGTLENKPCQNKLVKESVKKLLKEMLEHSSQQHDFDPPNARLSKNVESLLHSNVPAKQGDWLCPKCNFLNFARNIRCLHCDGLFQDRLQRLQEDQDHLPLKRGDWICEKCNFLNFAKNTRCLQCKEKPPKRQLNPGEWECESCNYINFRRNMVCLKCDHRRPKALSSPNNKSTKHDNGDYPKHSRLKINNSENKDADDKCSKHDRINQIRGAGMWRFVEGEIEGNDSNLWDKDSRFLDFPIVGGKSSLSQNEQKRERWKIEMLENSKAAKRTRDSDEVRYNDTQRTFKYLETTDDEDIADWFGHAKKMESECSLSETQKHSGLVEDICNS